MAESIPGTTLIADPKQRGILVVEDDLGPRESLRYMLKTRSYANVHFAQDGREAIDQLAAWGASAYLVLLDLRMPVMDGITFLRHIAAVCPHPMGVIAVTAFPTPAGKREFMEAGSPNVTPLDYVAKPFELADLLEIVSRSLDFIHAKRTAGTAV